MLDLALHGTVASRGEAVRTLASFCLSSGYSRKRVDEIISAVSETLSNALRHGNSGEESRPIRLRARMEGPALHIEVEDEGHGLRIVPPLPDLALKLSGADRPTGWGLFLIRSLSSEVSFGPSATGGTMVRMRFDRVAPVAPADIRLIDAEGRPIPPGDPICDT